MSPFFPIWKRNPKCSRNSFLPLKSFDFNTRKRSSGFTFIEIVIVSSVLAIVMIAIYSSFNSGMMLWQRSRKVSLTDRKVILGLERIAIQLRQSIDFQPSNLDPEKPRGFSGNQHQLSFTFLERYQYEVGNEKKTGLQISRATYTFDPDKKSLNRKIEKYQDILNGQEGEFKVFISSIDEVEFAYYYLDSERVIQQKEEEWKATDGVPLAVKITFKFQNVSTSTTISRGTTIFIPIATDIPAA